MKVKNTNASGKVHLSFDMDYWNEQDVNVFSRDFRQILSIVKSRNLPFCDFDEHHKILKFLNKRNVDTVVNVDYHSDIAEDDKWYKDSYKEKLPLNCGTWGNFVRKSIKENGTFLWVHPHSSRRKMEEWAYCHSIINPFQKKVTHWKQVEQKRIEHNTLISFLDGIWDKVDSVSFVTSTDFTDDDILHYAFRYLAELEIG
jgi:hypothetical protein